MKSVQVDLLQERVFQTLVEFMRPERFANSLGGARFTKYLTGSYIDGKPVIRIR